MTTIDLTRTVVRFYEYINPDGSPATECTEETFNVDCTPHWADVTEPVADSIDEAVTWMRHDGVRFHADGSGLRATDPDGSSVIDYTTGERETITWQITYPDSLDPVTIDAIAMLVDAVPDPENPTRLISKPAA